MKLHINFAEGKKSSDGLDDLLGDLLDEGNIL